MGPTHSCQFVIFTKISTVCSLLDAISKTIFVSSKGGSLLLAGRHVCIIPNVNILKKSDAEKLQKCKFLNDD